MSALSESILETIKSNGGTITIKEAEEKNISPKKLQRMVKQGSLERVTRGLYLHPEFLEDSYFPRCILYRLSHIITILINLKRSFKNYQTPV